jgi:flagellin-like hook-associated protein FlgL
MSLIGNSSSGAMSSILNNHTKLTNKLAKTAATKTDSSASNIADQLKQQSRIASAGSKNAQLSTDRQAVASDALGQASEVVGRLGELAARASDSTLSSSDRSVLQGEADQLRGELGDIMGNTSFNGSSILQGDSHTVHVDSSLSYSDADGSSITAALSTFDLSSSGGASAALASTQDAQNSLIQEQVKVETTSSRLSRAGQISELKSLRQGAQAEQQNDPVSTALNVKQLLVQKAQNESIQATLMKFSNTGASELI